MTVGEDLTALQVRLDAAQKEHLRAEGARDAALMALERAEHQLHTEYGVNSLDAAHGLLKELNVALEDCISNLNALLDKIEGGQA